MPTATLKVHVPGHHNDTVDITYSFTLPAAPGGGDTEVIKCVEMSSMDYSYFDIATGIKLDYPLLTCVGRCQLTTLVDAWFHNPLPFPITLAFIQFT